MRTTNIIHKIHTGLFQNMYEDKFERRVYPPGFSLVPDGCTRRNLIV